MSITYDLLRTLDATIPPPIDSNILPSAQSPDVILVTASSHEYAQTALLNSGEWSGPLNLQQYLEREVILQDTELTKDGRITGWILTSNALPPNPDGTRPILASCESLAISAAVAHNGELNRVQAHGIASVYTRPEHRGKGYAGRMMAELGKRLESWQSEGPTNPFSVLYSDIGKEFYAKTGWKPFDSTHIKLATLPRAQYDEAKLLLPSVKDLASSDLQLLNTIGQNESYLLQLSTKAPSKTFAAVRPDVGHFEWPYARAEYQARVLGKKSSSIRGAIHPETGLAIIWCCKYATESKDWQLDILYTLIPTDFVASEENQQALAALLLRAQVEAWDFDMATGVEIWDPVDLVVAAAQKLQSQEQGKVEIITRDREHLCSLRWAGAEPDDLVWIAKQKYAWC